MYCSYKKKTTQKKQQLENHNTFGWDPILTLPSRSCEYKWGGDIHVFFGDWSAPEQKKMMM